MPQTTSEILMIRPARPGFNAETSASNAFQIARSGLNEAEILPRVWAEFDNFTQLLQKNGVGLHLFQDEFPPARPDAVFPNNWLSFHEDGRVILYPMLAPNRRLERNPAVLDLLAKDFEITEVIEFFEGPEAEGRFLEGTGSLVLDREHREAFACISPRTEPGLLAEWAKMAGYESIPFAAADRKGQEIYHTNVIMGIGREFALICEDALSQEVAQDLRERFSRSGKSLIPISFEQMESFAGNLLEVQSRQGEPCLVMSQRGWNSLHSSQKKELERHGAMILPDLEVIETIGGGSARCMLAEIFLPRKRSSGDPI